MGDPKPKLMLTPRRREGDAKVTFTVQFYGFTVGQEVELSLFEATSTDEKKDAEKELGKIKGTIVALKGRSGAVPAFGLKASTPPPAKPQPPKGQQQPPPMAAFEIAGSKDPYFYEIPVTPEHFNKFEGEAWNFVARIADPKVESTTIPIRQVHRAVPVPFQATYDWHAHNKAKLFHGGSEDQAGSQGSIAEIVAAIEKATSFIFIADWSFQPYFRVKRGAGDAVKQTIGHLLAEKAKNGVLVVIHTWEHKLPFGIGGPASDWQNDQGQMHLDEIAGGKSKILWRSSSRDVSFMSHHQKYVLCDDGAGGRKDLVGFLGGIDMTRGRFDWQEHPVDPTSAEAKDYLVAVRAAKPIKDEHFKGAPFTDWYSAEFGADGEATADVPRQPWHDIHCRLDGPAVYDLVREFVGRWNNNPSSNGNSGDLPSGFDGAGSMLADGVIGKVNLKYLELLDNKKFIQQNEPRASAPWAAQIYRSIAQQHWAMTKPSPEAAFKFEHFHWGVNGGFERSIQDAYLQAIGQAEDFIYIETQYLISSGSEWRDNQRTTVENTLAKAIADRIITQKNKGKPFHAYFVIPMFPEGAPAEGADPVQRRMEWRTMEYMMRRLGDEWPKYLSFYFLARGDGPKGAYAKSGTRRARVAANNRYQIYVHSKMMIVDDRYIIVGSANLNERSLNGNRDTEICVGLWPSSAANLDACKADLKKFRTHLFSEHFGIPGDDPVAAAPGISAKAAANFTLFMSGAKVKGAMPFPFSWDSKKQTANVLLRQDLLGFGSTLYLPDSEKSDGVWGWDGDWMDWNPKGPKTRTLAE